MKLEVRDLTDRRAVLVLREVDTSFMNALRRTMISDVPKMAIEDVTVYDNTSALFDEILAHRLGLLPIPTDPGVFNFRAACTCNGEGCPNCTILYTLSKEGPGMVLSGDLTPADPRFAIPDADIPIVKLLEGQRVMLEAAAVLGTGKTHAKWAAVVAVGYRELPSVSLRPGQIPAAQSAELEKLAPRDALTIEDGRIRIVDEVKAFDFLRAAKERYDLGFVELREAPDAFLLKVETDGGITAKAALVQAIQMLMEKLKVVEQEAPKLVKEA